MNKGYEPPYKPKIENIYDVRNFEKEFWIQPATDSPISYQAGRMPKIAGFSYDPYNLETQRQTIAATSPIDKQFAHITLAGQGQAQNGQNGHGHNQIGHSTNSIVNGNSNGVNAVSNGGYPYLNVNVASSNSQNSFANFDCNNSSQFYQNNVNMNLLTKGHNMHTTTTTSTNITNNSNLNSNLTLNSNIYTKSTSKRSKDLDCSSQANMPTKLLNNSNNYHAINNNSGVVNGHHQNHLVNSSNSRGYNNEKDKASFAFFRNPFR